MTMNGIIPLFVDRLTKKNDFVVLIEKIFVNEQNSKTKFASTV